MEVDILNRGPDNSQATRLRGEHVNLIGALPHVTEEAFDGIGGLNMSVHGNRKCIERQGFLFLFSQASQRFGIAFAIFGLESLQLDDGLLFAERSRLGIALRTLRCLCEPPALTSRGRKQLPDGCQHAIMPIGHDEVDLGRPAST